MTTKEKAEKLADWWIADTYKSNHNSEWRHFYQQELMKLPLSEFFAVAEAANRLYLETADYITLNKLGDIHHNQSMKNMRDAIDSLRTKLKEAEIES